MPRVFKGNIPKDGAVIGTIEEWTLYRRPSVSPYYQRFKLISSVERYDRANYHLTYDVTLDRFVRGVEFKSLRRAHPALLAWALDVVETALAATPL